MTLWHVLGIVVGAAVGLGLFGAYVDNGCRWRGAFTRPPDQDEDTDE